MILHVEYAYQATVRPHRKRLFDTRHYLATQPVEVREVDGSQAPVALRTDTDRIGEGRRVREYRLFEGRLWTPRVDGQGKARTADWLAREAARALESHREAANVFSATVSDPGLLAGRLEDDATVAACITDDRDERAAEVREAASGILLVDGVPHGPAAEPVYEVRETNHGDYTFVYVEPYRAPGGARPSNFGMAHYRADEHAFLLERHQPTDVDRARQIEVLDPRALRAPLAEHALLTAATNLLEDLGKMVLRRDAAFFATYAALRDALPGLSRAVVEAEGGASAGPAAEAVAGPLSDAVAAIRAEDPEAGRRLGVQWAELALERHEARLLQSLPAPGL